MSDFDSIILGPDDFVILRPRRDFGADYVADLASRLPEGLRGRVLIVDPQGFDVLTFRPVGVAS